MVNCLFKSRKSILTWPLRLTTIALLAFLQISDPTYFPRIYYRLTDKLSETKIEKQLEKDFKTNYVGDSDETAIKNLYAKLLIIQNENPALLEHVKRIELLSRTVCDNSFVKAFNRNVGVARLNNSIELHYDYDINTLAHELAHIKYFNTSKKSKEKFNSLLEDKTNELSCTWLQYKFGKELPFWKEDNSFGPKYGYINVIGALDDDENLAYYVGAAYNDYAYPWNAIDNTDPAYKKVLNYLLEEQFITQKQYNKICSYAEF